jgi:dCMP deaminase
MSADQQAKGSNMTAKREDYISWQDYFMGIAILSAQRSKDPRSQVGACIVTPENKIVGIGYNGFPIGCSDDVLPWAREAVELCDTKYPYVCHAELNAIMNKNAVDIRGCRIYTTLFPCNECTKLIIQSGIVQVIYLSDKYRDTPSCRAARRMMDMVGLVYEQFQPKIPRIVIDFAQEAQDVTRV